MAWFLTLLLNALAVGISSYVLPGVAVDGVFPAILVAVVLGILNALVRPMLLLLALPINLLTMGLFVFVIDAVIVLLAAWVIPGFRVKSFWWALLFALVLAIVGTIINTLV